MEGKIYLALGKIMSEVGAVGKDQVNAQQNFKFRGIDDMLNSLHRLFAKYGVIVLPNETEAIQEPFQYTDSYGKVKYQFRSRIHFTFNFVSTEDGSSVQADGWGEAADNGDKGYNKCKSIALKYALMQMFLVPTADIADPDKETPDEITVDGAGKPKKGSTRGVKTTDDKSLDKPVEEPNTGLMEEAKAKIAEAKTKPELVVIYNDYGPKLNFAQEFRDALNARQAEIKKAK